MSESIVSKYDNSLSYRKLWSHLFSPLHDQEHSLNSFTFCELTGTDLALTESSYLLVSIPDAVYGCCVIGMQLTCSVMVILPAYISGAHA